jgi:hypothetical protein
VRVAVERGYLRNAEDRKGRPARLIVGEPMPEDAEILPSPEELKGALSGCAVDRDSEGIQHPPPPSYGTSEGETERGVAYYPSENVSTDQPEDEWGVV